MTKGMIMDRKLSTFFELFEYSTGRWPERIMSSTVDGRQCYSYMGFRDKVLQVSSMLSRRRIYGGNIAILSENMPNWTVAFFASAAMGRVAVPILPDSSPQEISNILEHSEARVLFISRKQSRKIDDIRLSHVGMVVCIDDFEVLYSEYPDAGMDVGCCAVPYPEELAVIIYTSGTSGAPKGVMLSHGNLMCSLMEARHAQPAGKSDRWLSILPMAHAYEMALGMLYPFSVGASVHYIGGLPTPTLLLEAMSQVRPTIILSVPLIIEKIHHKVMQVVSSDRRLSWLEANMPWLLNILIGIRLRRMTGGCLKFFGIGGAKLNPQVEAFLKKTHFPYAIGYGLTETAPLVCNAYVGRTKVGSIGVPAYGVEVRLDNMDPATGEGEIAVRGGNVMMGYYKDPCGTARVLDRDGWFRTGDLAAMDRRGRFYIKGRLGSMIVGATGENIYPEEIESVINTYPGVNESLVVERGRSLVGLVQLEDNLRDSAGNIRKAILDYVNNRVGRHSCLSRIEILTEPFRRTATHKIRRFLYACPAD